MIICSAIKFFYQEDKEHRFPQIWTGLRHADVFERMFMAGVKYDKESHVQGFMTDSNIFLDRYDAKHEARRCRQLIEDTDDKSLYSEDMWPED